MIERFRIGPREGPQLVFLHEGLGSAGLWRDFPARLCAETGLGALVYSRAGHGKSPPPARKRDIFFMHEEAALLPSLLEEEGIADAVLFGHSDGASIALLHAAKHPVRGLVLEAPHVFVEEFGLRSIEQAREEFLHGGMRARLAKHHDDPDAAFFGWNGPWLDPAFRSWNIESALPQIRAPMLVIQGTADRYGTLAQVDAVAQKSGGRVKKLLLEGCGHSPHRERADEVVAAAARFVRGGL